MANADPDRAAANDTPDNRLLAMMLGVAGTQLIGLAAELNIPDLLNDGARSIETIADCPLAAGDAVEVAHAVSGSIFKLLCSAAEAH